MSYPAGTVAVHGLTWVLGRPYPLSMSPGPSVADFQRLPFREGEPIFIIEPQGQRHFLKLRSGHKFHHVRTGHLAHDRIIGQRPGALILSETGEGVVCLRPTLEDYIYKGLKRRTSIIHPKDLATLVVRGDIYSGARVLEAGIGSGSSSIFLLRHLAPGGLLISYERRPEFIENALANIADFHGLYGDPGTEHRIVEGDIYDSIDAQDLDLVLLDVPEPFRAVDAAWQALRAGGTLLSWLPTVTQVYGLVRQLQEQPHWAVIETRETLERSWEIAENAMRPFHRMVGHTGFLIRARKLEAGSYG
jgi:tRNA (adenine57-N1/adenine58-N1)-methyltransferase catalytic subunit